MANQELPRAEKQRIIDFFMANPPRIGVVGVSGVGKSSTINRLFRTSLPTSDTVACTKEFRDVSLEVTPQQGDLAGTTLRLVVCDAPGLGEDIRKDPEYLDMYRQNLPACDVILWVTTARNRAIALDQLYLAEFPEVADRIVFGINQVDLVEPLDWPAGLPIPSPAQKANIREIVADRRSRFCSYLGRDVAIVPYSTSRGHNLEDLFTTLLEHAPDGRKWLFHVLKNFRLEDFLPTGIGSPRDTTAYSGAGERRATKRAGLLKGLLGLVFRPGGASVLTDYSKDQLSALETDIADERRRRNRRSFS